MKLNTIIATYVVIILPLSAHAVIDAVTCTTSQASAQDKSSVYIAFSNPTNTYLEAVPNTDNLPTLGDLNGTTVWVSLDQQLYSPTVNATLTLNFPGGPVSKKVVLAYASEINIDIPGGGTISCTAQERVNEADGSDSTAAAKAWLPKSN